MNKPAPQARFVEQFGMSERHLNRLFKRETGLTINKCIATRRLAQAENLLLNTNAPIQEVASSLGFKNQTMFSIFFRKHHGRSPSSFRQEGLDDGAGPEDR